MTSLGFTRLGSQASLDGTCPSGYYCHPRGQRGVNDIVGGDSQCSWKRLDHYYVQEGHGSPNECYPTLTEAKQKCLDAGDCKAVTSQYNVCWGWYRVTHGGPTLGYWPWNSWLKLHTYQATCTGPPPIPANVDPQFEKLDGKCSEHEGYPMGAKTVQECRDLCMARTDCEAFQRTGTGDCMLFSTEVEATVAAQGASCYTKLDLGTCDKAQISCTHDFKEPGATDPFKVCPEDLWACVSGLCQGYMPCTGVWDCPKETTMHTIEGGTPMPYKCDPMMSFQAQKMKVPRDSRVCKPDFHAHMPKCVVAAAARSGPFSLLSGKKWQIPGLIPIDTNPRPGGGSRVKNPAKNCKCGPSELICQGKENVCKRVKGQENCVADIGDWKL